MRNRIEPADGRYDTSSPVSDGQMELALKVTRRPTFKKKKERERERSVGGGAQDLG